MERIYEKDTLKGQKKAGFYPIYVSKDLKELVRLNLKIVLSPIQ